MREEGGVRLRPLASRGRWLAAGERISLAGRPQVIWRGALLAVGTAPAEQPQLMQPLRAIAKRPHRNLWEQLLQLGLRQHALFTDGSD